MRDEYEEEEVPSHFPPSSINTKYYKNMSGNPLSVKWESQKLLEKPQEVAQTT